MLLPPLSDEQEIVVDNINKGYNVIVDAVAGSGKTTTILYIVRSNPDKRILMLTYNSKLKIETFNKAKNLYLSNVDVRTYHSFAVNYYTINTYTDQGIYNILRKNLQPSNIYMYDMIILDEQQDMTKLYYQFVLKIIKDNKIAKSNIVSYVPFNNHQNINLQIIDPILNNNNLSIEYYNNFIKRNYDSIQICSLGDINQNIYKFKRADSRFLSRADELFKDYSNREWKKLSLHVTFRITKQMADFINNCCLYENRLISYKEGNPIEYYICNIYATGLIIDKIYEFIDLGYKYDDIFIIAPSISPIRLDSIDNRKRPITNLANDLTNNNIPIFVSSTNDNETLDEEIIKNKILFSTIHQSKGMERKIVFLYGFDESYFKYYSLSTNGSNCSNELYVALTRSLERLIIIHNYKYNYVPFLSRNISEYCNLLVHDLFKDLKHLEICNLSSSISENNISNKDNKLNDKLDNKLDNILEDNKLEDNILEDNKLEDNILEDNKLEDNILEDNIKRNINIISLIGHLSAEDIDECMNYISYTQILQPNDNNIWLRDKINSSIGTKESVSDINGLILNSAIEYYNTGSFFAHRWILSNAKNQSGKSKIYHRFPNYFFKSIENNYNQIGLKQLTKICLAYKSLISGFDYRMFQIDRYGWFSKNILDQLVSNVNKYLSKNLTFSKNFYIETEDNFIYGRANIIDNNTNVLWRLKFSKKLTQEDIILTSLYIWLTEKKYDKYFLMSSLTGEIIEISLDSNINKLLEHLFNIKKRPNLIISDEEFTKYATKFI